MRTPGERIPDYVERLCMAYDAVCVIVMCNIGIYRVIRLYVLGKAPYARAKMHFQLLLIDIWS